MVDAGEGKWGSASFKCSRFCHRVPPFMTAFDYRCVSERGRGRRVKYVFRWRRAVRPSSCFDRADQWKVETVKENAKWKGRKNYQERFATCRWRVKWCRNLSFCLRHIRRHLVSDIALFCVCFLGERICDFREDDERSLCGQCAESNTMCSDGSGALMCFFSPLFRVFFFNSLRCLVRWVLRQTYMMRKTK